MNNTHSKGVYAVWDHKAQETIVPFLMLHRIAAVAIREFTELYNAPKSPIRTNPEDFALVTFGHFTDDNKTFIGHFEIVCEASAIAAMKSADPTNVLPLPTPTDRR